MVTEFYTKGEDTKLDNSSGAGFVVRDQQNRGFAYQHFTLGLLEAKNCVGWVFFKYLDDEDCNKGMLDYNYKPYTSLTKYMSDINSREPAFLIETQTANDLVGYSSGK